MYIKKLYRNYIEYLKKKPQKIRLGKQWLYEWYGILKEQKVPLIHQCRLSKEQKKEIQDYWIKEYGKKIPLLWHRKYYAYSGKSDKRYFPEIFYTTMLEPKFNPDKIARVLEDKSLIVFLYSQVINSLPNLVVPKTICGCASGFYYDGNRHPIAEEDFFACLREWHGNAIIKPTIGGNSGHGVKLLSLEQGMDKRKWDDIEKTVRKYGKDFMIQQKIQLHPDYARLHFQSCNTIRVMTYRTRGGEIKAAPCSLRIGRGESHLDNGHAGGIFVAVDDNGNLGKWAMDCNGNRFEYHPDSHIYFADYHVPFVCETKSAAIQLHECLPNLGFVNWDFAINSENQICLIESNLSCGSLWLFQDVQGQGVFGEDTEWMIKNISRKYKESV